MCSSFKSIIVTWFKASKDMLEVHSQINLRIVIGIFSYYLLF